MKNQFLNMLPKSDKELRELCKRSGVQYRQIIGFVKGINTITLDTVEKLEANIATIKEN